MKFFKKFILFSAAVLFGVLFFSLFFTNQALAATGARTTTIQLRVYGTSTCGNAIIEWPEVCDDGANNGLYGYCKNDCTALGPYCGDAVCDAGNETCSTCATDCGACPVTPGNSGSGFIAGGGGSAPYPIIFGLSAPEIDSYSAKIIWNTSQNAICQLSWGKTADYEQGSVAENNYYTSHFTILSDLTPQTTYHFLITCRNDSLLTATAGDYLFTTLPLPASPAEVPLSGTKEGPTITLPNIPPITIPPGQIIPPIISPGLPVTLTPAGECLPGQICLGQTPISASQTDKTKMQISGIGVFGLGLANILQFDWTWFLILLFIILVTSFIVVRLL